MNAAYNVQTFLLEVEWVSFAKIELNKLFILWKEKLPTLEKVSFTDT